ncbi:MAG: GAF domain-containing sensor histidine kinase [Aphanothece sp. CMT-3BRIN-NPC111]|jgi:signal transduction histidine kinase|nr:GAF domain-containing sensor histidine kinase [Aphanothece sp. CMT-3BRIN-NPC111]
MKAPLPNNEAQRIEALRQYQILDTEAEQAFDDLTSLAARICHTPSALVSLIDSDRQWFKSKVGLRATETCRDLAFCAYAILQTKVFVVENALSDARFAANPLVTSDPHIRFYAGAPLISSDGLALGTLCVIDYVPRKVSLEQQEALEILAHQVMTQLELRRNFLEATQALTKRQNLEAELCKALEKEKELSELKSRFISITSHEFRTPLTTILSSAELLEHYSQKWSEEKKLRHLHRIQASVKSMAQMLDDVLVMGKAEQRKLEFNPAPLDLEKFCHELVEEMQLGDNNQHSIRFIAQGQCSDCWLDEQLLRQILSYLFSNAFKYSPQGSTVNFELVCLEGEVIFQIQDTGIGIPSEDQVHIFDSFHRATNVEMIPGTGLGLAVVKKCVDLHGGNITVGSEVGSGSTFRVTLPLNNKPGNQAYQEAYSH